MEDTLVYFGDQVKSTADGKVGGYLVRFTDPKSPDLSDDFFSKSTELGVVDGQQIPVFYNHGYDRQIKRKRIGRAIVKFDDAGLWLEAQLEARDEYEEMILKLAQDGKLGWSSGAAGHLVEREQIGKAWHIETWVIGEASLTPTPAEPRNSAVPLKSLITPEGAVRDGDTKTTNHKEKEIMDTKELLDAIKTQSAETANNAAESAALKAAEMVDQKIKAFQESLPDITAGFEVKKDAADNKQEGSPLHGGEFYAEVKNAASGFVSTRMKAHLKALGINEAIPSQGGFILPQVDKKPMLERMYSTGEILGRVVADGVTGNGMDIPAVDETSRVNGSRQGGILSYWRAEAGDYTASKPKFREMNLKLKSVDALVYATDEMLEDVAFMESWISRNAPDELRFRVEDAIFEGDGVGKPLGWMNSPALIQVTREDASEVSFNDIVNMWSRRWSGVNDYVWLVNQDVQPQLDRMYLGDGATGIIPPRFIDYDSQGTLRMKGKPVIEIEYASTLGTLGDILLVSPSQYQLIDKASGIKSASSIHVEFLTGQTAFRFTYRVDGEPTWNSALTPFKGTNTQSPIVGLAASS